MSLSGTHPQRKVAVIAKMFLGSTTTLLLCTTKLLYIYCTEQETQSKRSCVGENQAQTVNNNALK